MQADIADLTVPFGISHSECIQYSTLLVLIAQAYSTDRKHRTCPGSRFVAGLLLKIVYQQTPLLGRLTPHLVRLAASLREA